MKKFAEAGMYAILFGRGEGQQSGYWNDYYMDGQLYIMTRAQKNFYEMGGVYL